MVLGLTSAAAYVPEHLGGEGTPVQESAPQVETAVLLGEDGTPRCFIGKHPSESLVAENFDFTTLDALEECDQSDELYTRTVLGNEEISLGMAAPPAFIKGAEFAWEAGKVALPVFGIGLLSSCLPVGIARWIDLDKWSPFTHALGVLFVGVGSLFGGLIGGVAFVSTLTQAEAVYLASAAVGITGFGAGFFVCGEGKDDRRY